MYAQPLVESIYTKVTAWPLVDNDKLFVPELIGWPFLSTVTALDPKVPLASIITTSFPTEGEIGKVIVTPVWVVFIKSWSPATAVYAVIEDDVITATYVAGVTILGLCIFGIMFSKSAEF